MNIGMITHKPPYSFKGFWNNKAVLKGLEFVSEHGAGFTAGVSFVMASGVRPLAVMAAPDVKKENKQYGVINSIVSGAVKFALTLCAAIPIENAAKAIEKNPEKFLKPETIKAFQKNAASLSKSRDFRFAMQTVKNSAGFISAAPKAMITAALIPVIAVKFLDKQKKKTILDDKTKKEIENKIYEPKSPVFAPVFKGGITNAAAKGIGALLDLKPVQKAAAKFSSKDGDIARSMAVSTDLMLTASFALSINKNKKIDKERRKPLILNSIYGTAFSIAAGYTADELVKKNTAGFIEKFKELHKNNPKLPKYIEGINIARPVLIFSGIYYGILPIITAYLADKTSQTK